LAPLHSTGWAQSAYAASVAATAPRYAQRDKTSSSPSGCTRGEDLALPNYVLVEEIYWPVRERHRCRQTSRSRFDFGSRNASTRMQLIRDYNDSFALLRNWMPVSPLWLKNASGMRSCATMFGCRFAACGHVLVHAPKLCLPTADGGNLMTTRSGRRWP